MTQTIILLRLTIYAQTKSSSLWKICTEKDYIPLPPIAIMYLLSLIENILLRMESIKIIQQ